MYSLSAVNSATICCIEEYVSSSRQSLQFSFPICLCHHFDLAPQFLIWKTPPVLSIHFTAHMGSDMNLADSSVAYCVSGLSCPTVSAVPIKDLHCCVSRSSRPSAPSRKPLPTVFEPAATVTFHFVCSSCFLPTKPNSSAKASV